MRPQSKQWVCYAIAAVLACLAFAPAAEHRAASGLKETRNDHRAGYRDLLSAQRAGDGDVLRIREDALRRRLWVLTSGSIYVYDTANRTLLRRILLPGWSIAGFEYAGPPDLALDRDGAAYVSNNVEPRLLVIEPANFATREYRLRLVSRPDADMGFGSLRFASDGMLLATGTTAPLSFRIDLRAGTAQELPPALPRR